MTKATWYILAAIIVTTTSCSTEKGSVQRLKPATETDQANIKVVQGSASYIDLSTLDRIKSNNNSIVVGKPLEAFLGRQHFYTTLQKSSDPLDSGNFDYLNDAWSEGNFQVEQVLYQRPGDPIAAGQTIRYAEPVGLFVEDGQTIKTMMNKCFELKQNARYILVLDRHSNGVYWLVNLNNGRFNTDGSDSDDELNGATLPDGTKTGKQKLREELTAAYGINFTTGPARVLGGINYRGVPGPNGARAKAIVEIKAPQLAGSRLVIEHRTSDTSPWVQIADEPVTTAAQSGTSPVSQEVLIYTNYYLTTVRARIVNNTQVSTWSAPYNYK